MKHLWEYDHPYYASESNYYTNRANDPGVTFDSWDEFVANFGDADLDMNLLIRWDWKRPDPDDYDEGDMPDHDTLQMTYVFQRKGLYAAHLVTVTESDEPQVREFIARAWGHMQKLWEGS